MYLYRLNDIFWTLKMVDFDRPERDPSDETIRIWNFPSVESYDNCRNFYLSKKIINSKLSKIYISNFGSTILRLESTLCQNFTFIS